MARSDLMIFLYYFIGAFFLSLLINMLFLKFAKTLGIRGNGDAIIRWGNLSKPSFGGISFYLVFLISFVAYFLFFSRGYELQDKRLIGLFIASSFAFLMGLADDAYNTRPLLKLFVQICCGIILVITDKYIILFDYPLWNYLLTIFWVVAVMNSINMLDNMDAIATIVSIVIISAILILIFLIQDFTDPNIIILTGILSSLLGFLIFNWHPSKLYMGDTGSQFLGIFLATMAIKYFWNNTSASNCPILSRQFIIVILAFIVPIIDTTVVVVNRLLKGRSPFVGGRDHTTHYLFFNGITERRIAILYGGISFFSLLLSIYIIHYISDWNYIHVILFSLYFLFLFGILFRVTRKNRYV